jgi:peptidoglycan/xylan/chitin deacetylase (PgdA/CDA1 family)
MAVYTKYLKTLFCSASKLIPLNILKYSSPKIILPTYHLVSDETPIHIKHLYKSKSKKEFVKDLDFILKYYKAIDLNELIKINKEDLPLPENYFHLSFDDGLRECYDIILPILKEKGIPATFFINPNFIDNKALMYRYKASILIDKISNNKTSNQKNITYKQILNIPYSRENQLDDFANFLEVDFNYYLKKQKPYMKTQEIEKLILDGFTIGAHSMDHPEYSQLSLKEQIRQTKESIEYIKNTFRIDYKVFAFPFTDDDVSKKFFETIFDPANPLADLTFGVAGIKNDVPFNLQRIPMEKSFSGKSIIKGDYLYYYFKKLIGKNKIRRN